MRGTPDTNSDGSPVPAGRSGPAVRAGARDVAPLVVGYAPFALLVGAAVADGPQVAARWASTFVVLGGSAQLVVLRLLDGGSPLALVVLGGLAANARLLAYSGSLSVLWRDQPRRFRALGAAFLIDATWALAVRHHQSAGGGRAHRAYYLAAAGTLTVAWGSIVTAGVFVGARLAGTQWLALAAPLSLVALVVPQVQRPRAVVVVAVASALAWFGTGWAAGTGLLAAMAVGAVVGATRGEDPA